MRDKRPAQLVAERLERATFPDGWVERPAVPSTAYVGPEWSGAAVVEHWTSDLLIHAQDVTPGEFSEVSLVDDAFRDCTWLERFSAKRVYELGRNLWPMPPWSRARGLDPVRRWESGKGPSLLLGSHDSTQQLYRQLLELVLPKVCTVQMSERGAYFVTPMKRGWQDTLENWRSFIRDPVPVGPFVEYVGGGIWELLSWECLGSRYLNSKYAPRFADWKTDDLVSLKSALDALVYSRGTGQAVRLYDAQETALEHAIEVGPELWVGGAPGKWRLRDLRGQLA